MEESLRCLILSLSRRIECLMGCIASSTVVVAEQSGLNPRKTLGGWRGKMGFLRRERRVGGERRKKEKRVVVEGERERVRSVLPVVPIWLSVYVSCSTALAFLFLSAKMGISIMQMMRIFHLSDF